VGAGNYYWLTGRVSYALKGKRALAGSVLIKAGRRLDFAVVMY
jgi:hypothetical protein